MKTLPTIPIPLETTYDEEDGSQTHDGSWHDARCHCPACDGYDFGMTDEEIAFWRLLGSVMADQAGDDLADEYADLLSQLDEYEREYEALQRAYREPRASTAPTPRSLVAEGRSLIEELIRNAKGGTA